MPFSLEKLFGDVFAPRGGERVAILCDRPHRDMPDTADWAARRRMAAAWQAELTRFAPRYGLRVDPIVHYDATGAHNSDLPDVGEQAGRSISLDGIAAAATIVLCFAQFSASAPLVGWTRRHPHLRVASLPMVSPAMEETALSADYGRIAERCAVLARLFDGAAAIEVIFSTGDRCRFDISDGKPAIRDDGRLHPDGDGSGFRLRNLPSGEVFVVPVEGAGSGTAGRIPVVYGAEPVVFEVRRNRIVAVHGDGPVAARRRREFEAEPALCNVAEVAVGCNDRAVVTGNVLEDEKAGFHWAYGRSDHMGGTVGPEAFSAPDKVFHLDIVYATGNPVVCARLDFVTVDGIRTTAVRDGQLCVGD